MDLDEAEFANEAFYLAFEAKDFGAMEHLWSRAHEVVCIHPGWPALVGRKDVMESWRGILGNPEQPQVSCYGARCRRIGGDAVMVVCYERMPGTTLIATNVFVREEGRLRMVLHQSGPCANPPADDGP